MTDAKFKKIHRLRRHRRVRAKIKGTAEKPRVSVYKSHKYLFVQFIDDEKGSTILSNKIESRTKSKTKTKNTKMEKAFLVGQELAESAKGKGIKKIIFDRGGFKYHGRIKALADGLRKGGFKF